MAKAGRPKNPPKPKKMLKEIVPLKDIFNEDEISLYKDYVDVYLQDFDEDDLTSHDTDDIMDLAKNRILEMRLLKSSANDIEKQVDVSAALEKLRKQNDKFKENLSARRKDRINPNEFRGFSIVDLAVAFDDKKKEQLNDQIKKNKLEESLMIEARSNYNGNRADIDVDVVDEEEMK